jgi:hypothetical protein
MCVNVVGMTHAETTALPGAKPGRAARIAAIYMFAHWLIEHTDVPVPNIMATWSLDQHDEVDQATRYAAVDAVAELLDAREYGRNYGDQSPQFDYVVAAPEVHGIEIIYRGTTFSDDYYGRRL